MNIAFYVDEMNLRGVANSTYQFAYQNKKTLKNKSIIFYNKRNYRNKNNVIKKFKSKFRVIGISEFKEIDSYKDKFLIDYIYVQKGGNKDNWVSNKIKTLVHAVYPQKINQVHGYRFAYISEWLSKNFSSNKIPFVPLITEINKTKENLKKKLKISKDKLVLGCYGGESSFDLRFAQSAIKAVINKRKDITFLFLNINRFCSHKQIKFLKGTTDEKFKKKFINSCDAMIYGRSLGESFGLSCGEFAIENKLIVSYKFNRHRSHSYNIPSNQFIEYKSYNTLAKILLNLKKKSSIYKNKYKNYSHRKMIKVFQNVFLKNNETKNFTLNDKLKNSLSFIVMGYLYLRHKLYENYFNYFEVKFIRLILK